jgi:hypothetical protein
MVEINELVLKDIKSIEVLVKRQIYIVVRVESKHKLFDGLGINQVIVCNVKQKCKKNHRIGRKIVVY